MTYEVPLEEVPQEERKEIAAKILKAAAQINLQASWEGDRVMVWIPRFRRIKQEPAE